MATTQLDISRWFDQGLKEGATHMLIVCDTFDHSDYPVYLTLGENIEQVHSDYINGKFSMQKVMEIYSMKLDKESQLKEHRTFHYD